MLKQQLNLFDEGNTRLDVLMEWSFGVFDRLLFDYNQLVDQYFEPCPNPWFDEKAWLAWFKQKHPVGYQLAFSGGKDSHVLLGVYLMWMRSRNATLPIKVVFSDTFLETPRLHELVDNVAQLCDHLSIPFVKVHPPIEKSFWVLLVGRGYPVPNWKNRWCTEKLKGEPMRKLNTIGITGRHTGESSKRDLSLQTCGSSECGIDQVKNSVDPLTPWKNCDVWDWIILFSDDVLYQGVSDALLSFYEISESQNGSLRMGCIVCPVVGRAAIAKQVDDGIIPRIALQAWDLINTKLRFAPRILSERTGKAGAIHADSRIEFWNELQPLIPELRRYGWLSEEVEYRVNELLRDRAYPPTYKTEWIKKQEPLATTWNSRKNRKTHTSDKHQQLVLF
jgi:3'-phosphoadenosine 5'-phosphosulfate sulfotransferase (PAPS reductase)/FAD synthetase